MEAMDESEDPGSATPDTRKACVDHLSKSSIVKSRDVAGRSVYVSNFKHPVPKDDLMTFMSRFGRVEKLYVDKCWSRFAIVEYSSREEAQKVLEMKELQLDGRKLLLKPGKPKTEVFFAPEKATADQVIEFLKKIERESLEHQLSALREEFGISDENRNNRIKVTKFLEKHIGQYFADRVNMELFGSSTTGLGTRNADIDLNLTVVKISSFEGKFRDASELNEVTFAELIQKKLCFEEFEGLSAVAKNLLIFSMLQDIGRRIGVISLVKQVPKSKVPILTFVYNNEFACELSIDNYFSVIKANFVMNIIREPTGILHKLLFAFRLWAEVNELFGSEKLGTESVFKSYAFSLVLVAFLQNVGLLQRIQVRGQQKIGTFYVDYLTQPLMMEKVETPKLISGFLKFLMDKLQVKRNDSPLVISIRDGAIYRIQDYNKEGDAAKTFTENKINVIDPLETTHNVCSNLGKALRNDVICKCKIAAEKVEQNPNSLLSLFDLSETEKPFRPEWTIMSFPMANDVDGRQLIELVQIVIEDVLKMTPTEERADVEAKRFKGDEERFYFSQKYMTCRQVWLGRREKQRELKKKYPNEPIWRIEQMVTRECDKNALLPAMSPENASFVFDFVAEYIPDEDQLYVKMTENGNRQNASLHPFHHFFEQLMTKNNYSVLRSLFEWKNGVKENETSENMDIDG